ncbi:MAG: translation initiation factor IF-2 [Candidatus Omnitrophica bacterium]|nr:translation initiation factor IF-2 [Candidatus Omnitrophota bacterium]
MTELKKTKPKAVAKEKTKIKTVSKVKAVKAKTQAKPVSEKPKPRIADKATAAARKIPVHKAKLTEKKKITPAAVAPAEVVRETAAPEVKLEAKAVPPKAAPVQAAPKVSAPDIKEAAQKIIHKKEEKEIKKELPVEKKPEEKAPEPKLPPVPELKELELKLPISVKDLSVRLQEKPSVIIKTLMGIGVMAGINQGLDETVVTKICNKYGFKIKPAPTEEEVVLGSHSEEDAPESLKQRAAVVTLMGHVDHGKTSLLDAIRKSKVTESEHGGITQHIGAYRISLPHGKITFLDTPGHEAFTAMRARGASITDIVVLVVAADEGIMPQTQEAIDHARAAGVSIMVAINKVDKPQADIDRVKKQLAAANLNPEDWGGKTITVPVSAKAGTGIDELLEMILLEAQMLELKANPDRLAKGVVIEAKSHKNKGPIATLLVQNGTLHLNDNIILGHLYGKIRAMFNDLGHSITEAGPSVPIEVMGISGLPQAGEQFFAIKDEKQAKEFALKRQEKEKEEQMKPIKRMGLEDLYSQIKEGKLKELKLIIKADAQGSLEAIKDVLGKIPSTEISMNIIHEGIGNINISDVILAVASNALILGFNVVVDDTAKEMIAKEGQEVRTYNIIYELANDIRAALEGMLEPKLKKIFVGKAEIRKVFKLSRSGTIAGSFVTKGKIMRGTVVDLVRNGQVVYEGELASLKRFKDDVREVAEGFECGLALKGFDAVMEGDIVEAYQIEKIARKL